jgi:hypothetical protein
MSAAQPVERFGELIDRFPGIDESDPKALGRLAFYATRDMPGGAVDEALFDGETGEPAQTWHGPVQEVLEEVGSWLRWEHEERSRSALVSGIMRSQREQKERNTFLATLQEASADEGYARILSYLEEHGFRVQTEIGPSPFFPEGRTAYTTLEDAIDPETGTLTMTGDSMLVGQDGEALHRDLEDYIQKQYPRKRLQEAVDVAVATIEELDPDQFKQLCVKYGAKAAGLISFEERVTPLNETLKDNSRSVRLSIPPFLAVDVAEYERWLENPAALPEISEPLRTRALELKEEQQDAQGGLVVVRSSAVKSEDGEEHTGAGIYKSIVVDPNDSEGFQKAIGEVYESTRSAEALSYQQSIGVADEKMGLVIQHYEEGSGFWGHRQAFYGYANGGGANPNILEVHTSAGTLLYDKQAVQGMFMIESSEMWGEDILHTNPDHGSPVKDAISPTSSVPHAVLLAEKIFGKSMQVEFVNDSIVQVRPLILNLPESPVPFPEDIEPLAESAATGVGDMELQMLNDYEINSDERGFVVFYREYEFSLAQGHAGYNALPREGAVIVLRPSHSGHIQQLCREKGLLCFYPKKGGNIDHIESLLAQGEYTSQNEQQAPKLRFIADGYEGRIYKA